MEARQAYLLKYFTQKLEGDEGSTRNQRNHSFFVFLEEFMAKLSGKAYVMGNILLTG